MYAYGWHACSISALKIGDEEKEYMCLKFVIDTTCLICKFLKSTTAHYKFTIMHVSEIPSTAQLAKLLDR